MARLKSFRANAIASSLVTDEDIGRATHRIEKSTGGVSTTVSDKRLATELVRMRVLTTYQADQLLAGRTKLTLGPYLITDWIGQGGMGQVFKAVHKMLGRESAVKVLPLHKTTPEAIESFRREIRAQAKLDHPNLVRAFDAGEDGNVHYLVVEFVPGTDLRRLVRSKGKLTVQQSANIVRQSAEGLAHAHERNLIHRDVKPGNILVTPDGIAKVSDLGLAFYLNDSTDPRSGKIVGTADYLSPEQIRTPTRIKNNSDIYSLGCTLYYAVTGKVPFAGGNSHSKARRHLEETPWHPRRFNDEVSDDFADLIGDMMEKDPSRRIRSALEVAERLAPWAADNSPLLREELDDRKRWMSSPSPAGSSDSDVQGMEVADLAMSEITDASMESQNTIRGDDLPTESGLSGDGATALPSSKPPVPVSMVAQYSAAGRIPRDDYAFSLPTLIMAVTAFFVMGGVAGFIIGYFAGN